jgi:hypothetical protein
MRCAQHCSHVRQLHGSATIDGLDRGVQDFLHFFRNGSNVCLLFELVDYATDNFKSMPEGGWHRIAWGFLKLVSKNQGKPKVCASRDRQLFSVVLCSAPVPC